MTTPLRNPFVITKAEQFNHSYAQLAALMHLKPGVADILLSNSNVFIDGSRGSGKSMYLRLLSLPVKATYERLAGEGSVEPLPAHGPLLGVYAKLTPTIFGPHEYEEESGFFDVFQQLFNVYCIEQMLVSIAEAKESRTLEVSEPSELKIVRAIAKVALPASAEPRSLHGLVTALREERKAIRQLLNRPPFRADQRSQPETLWEAAELIAANLSVDAARVHLLIDEYDSLSIRQQQHVNSYLRKRDYPLTFKIACKKHRLILADRNDTPLNPSGDYDRVELDDDDFGLNSNFSRYLEAIANRRLECIGVTSGVREILGSRARENRAKTERQYAGFDTIAMLSSGVVRTFLELCRDIFSHVTLDPGGTISSVPPVVQDKVIKSHASNKWSSLARDQSARPELQHLIEQIAHLFALRSEYGTEKQVIRLEVLDYNRTSKFLRSLLEQALEYEALVQPNRERLQKNQHAASRGYLLHRLLCVHFRLSLQSRWDVEISSEQLEKLVLGTRDALLSVSKQPSRTSRESLSEERSHVTLFSHAGAHCPILNQQCPGDNPVPGLGFLSCRLPEAGKINDAVKLLKEAFANNSRNGKPYELKTALDYPPVGDIACKVCSAYSQSEFVVVEFSRLSPSVAMELGLAVARRLPTYVLFNKDEQKHVPEPFASFEYSLYAISPNGVKELVGERLLPFIQASGADRGVVRFGPEQAQLNEGEGVFISLPNTEYCQETLLPRLRKRLEDAGLRPVVTEYEGQALQDLQRAAMGIASAKFCLIDTTDGAPTRAMYLGMAQGYRKAFANLIDIEADESKRVFANARSKAEIPYRDSEDLLREIAKFFARYGVTV
ncbi:MAG TPA: hypothetical protein VHU83_20815 [Bryobacteraceae bacterium]|jgi:hypothetical protein|nr:hypothetical protein [Bryobacteraceae bacterium]